MQPDLSKPNRPRDALDLEACWTAAFDRSVGLAALIPRIGAPFEGRPALIGGYVHADEDRDADATAKRVLAAKAGLKNVYAEQLRTFSGQARDPRGWSASIAYVALVPADRLAKAAPTVLPAGTQPD